jgi:hypothetical protein
MFIAVTNFTIMAFIAVSVMPECNLAVVTGTAELSAPVASLGNFSSIPFHQKIKLSVTYSAGEFRAMQPVRKVYRLLPVCFRSPVNNDIAILFSRRKRRQVEVSMSFNRKEDGHNSRNQQQLLQTWILLKT